MRIELGVGRADDETNQELGDCQEEYNEAKERFKKVGRNTDILDINLGVCNKLSGVIYNRETLDKKLVNNKATTSDGRAFKFIGTTMVNGPYLLEAKRVQVEEEAKEARNRVSVVKMKGGFIKQDNIATYNKFLKSGRLLDKPEHTDLDKKEFTAIIKFILHIVSPNKATSLS